MSARVTFLLGRAGTGKSTHIFDALKEHQLNNERAVLIVPEQYTFEAENALSDALGGIIGIEVLSFQRLNERILSLAGQSKPYLSPVGYRTLIRRSILKNADALSVFARSSRYAGFTASMQEIFTDMKRTGITPDMLAAALEKLPEGSPIREKLTDIHLLYADTEAFLAERYLTQDDAVNAAMALLPQSFVQGAPVYIDGIDRPSKQLFSWLRALMNTAGRITVSLTLDPDASLDADLFDPNRMILDTLTGFAAELGIPVETVAFRSRPCPPSDALCHLERELFSDETPPYERATDEVGIFGASDRVRETESLADSVLAYARRGIRYREMAVIVSDPAAYLPLVERAFSKRGIPVYLDTKHPVTSHAAIDFALSALHVIESGFAAVDVLRLVKSGYAGISNEDAEVFENYVLAYGINGTLFLKPFRRGEVPEAAEAVRAALTAPLLTLRENLHRKTVGDKVRAFYAYLTESGLREQLEARTQALLDAGRISLSEEHAQVYNTLIKSLDELDAIMGDTAVSRTVFTGLVAEGLAGSEVGTIPGTRDQVLLGDLARTKSRAVRILFFVGVNEGLLPAARNDDGILNDADLKKLSDVDCPVWASNRLRSAEDRLDLYSAVSKASTHIRFSYAFSADGAELSPSPLIARVLSLFPHCRVRTDLDDPARLPISAASARRCLAGDLSRFYAGRGETKRLGSLIAAMRETEGEAATVERMLSAAHCRYSLPPLGKATMKGLFGSTVPMSASRIEQFSSCPFKHFVRYILRANERMLSEERKLDLGTLYHAALDAFTRHVLNEERDWRTVDAAYIDSILPAILDALLDEHNFGIYRTNDRLRVTIPLLYETVRAAVLAVAAQACAGTFVPIGSEITFGQGKMFPPIPLTLSDGTRAFLSGMIDRLDRASTPEGDYLRVIDYKSGQRDFALHKVLAGLTLQLPLYLDASLLAKNLGKAAGMYYMPLTVPADDEGAEEALLTKAFRLNGLTLNDPVVFRATDADESGGTSAILKGVKRTKTGEFSGAVAESDDLRGLIAQARVIASKAFERMMAGEIHADPVEKTCDYCEYNTVCRFDPSVPGCRTRKLRTVKISDLHQILGGDGDGVDK